MILWDVSLGLYFLFLFVSEDTVSFKFGGICVGIWVGSELFVYFGFIFLILIVFFFYPCIF